MGASHPAPAVESMKKTQYVTNQQAQEVLRQAEAVTVLDAVFPANPFATAH